MTYSARIRHYIDGEYYDEYFVWNGVKRFTKKMLKTIEATINFIVVCEKEKDITCYVYNYDCTNGYNGKHVLVITSMVFGNGVDEIYYKIFLNGNFYRKVVVAE